MQLPTSNATNRKPYDGTARKLVIAFDVGTTFSGVSYSILDPGSIPITQGVTSFPAQGKVGGSAKIPSILYYDQEGRVRAVGSEATEPAFIEQAEEEGFIKVSWFKLHLRPDSLQLDFDIPALPENKTPVTVFSDFLRYLFECTKLYIQRDTLGSHHWDSVQHNIDFILAHPNGWEVAQQAQMRRAAIVAGLVSEGESQERVNFVTEGEASLHFCINRNIPFENNNGVIIVDAGGGTVDLSAYRQTPTGSFEEIVTSQCIGQGSVFVGRRAHQYLQERLKDSRFGSEEDVQHIASIFDADAKHTFRKPTDPVFVKFGTFRDRDPTVEIKAGQLKIPGNVVQTFFEPSIRAIIQAVTEQRKEATFMISSVFLAGGFSANDWLFWSLKNELEPLNLTVSRPDAHLNKAVADGALSYYLDHFVSVRVARLTYGTDCVRVYNPRNMEHMRRRDTVITQPSGRKVVPNVFSVILSKGMQVDEETEFKEHYSLESSIRAAYNSVSVDIIVYRGKAICPEWTDVDPRMFNTWGTVYADVSEVVESAGIRDGRFFFRADFQVVILFGGPEIKAQISWQKNGKENRSPALVICEQINQIVR
ncbi:hypothetical protein J3R30DRAFT_1080306 [Lentinula aciculospora]|uniref:Actin-like ATPase domain-containing protein n=1 Tax=Lentinula aciculospora TaxID=153920 RepID=A0A9W9DJ08_9AGAR|nr:hypothetical protein J3R30DRAFT_1080306 [Lentinula aciculospora]